MSDEYLHGDGYLRMFRYTLPNPPVQMIIITNVDIPSDEEVKEALAVLKQEDPDEYALLMEHIPFPDHVVPKED